MTSSERGSHLRWPPPGLERLQGDLWRVSYAGALAGGILVLPIVFVAVSGRAFASLGPFADAWWVTLVLAAVGLAYAMDAYVRFARMLKRTATALESGYDWRTVGYVLADLRRDMGFLRRGERHFSVLDARERAAIAGLRVCAATLLALGGLWLPAALALMLLLASKAGASPTSLWTVTLLPSGLAYLIGATVSAAEDGRVRRARSVWYSQPWAADLSPQEIESWRASAGLLRDAGGLDRPRPGGTRLLRRLALAASVAAVAIAVPILTLVPSSAIGPTLARIAVPRFDQAHRRAAAAEGFRAYRAATDGSLGPQAAGELLHALLYVGSERIPDQGEREPAWRIDSPWLPAVQRASPLGVEPHRFGAELFGLVRAGLGPEARAYLEAVASHPGHAHYSALAGAARIDVASGRWVTPFPVGLSVATVPVPSVGGIRSASYAHLAVAAHHLAGDRPEAAEQHIRETISMGFLLGDGGLTVLENLVGHVIVEAGGVALESFYEATGRVAEAGEVHRTREAAERAASRIHLNGPATVESMVRSLPAMVIDPAALRGVRWEYFTLTTTLTPCLNLHRMVFGPDVEYAAFLERARHALVDWPSEEGFFRLARAGYWGALEDAPEGWIGRVLGLAMRDGEGTCGYVVRRFGALPDAVR